MKTLKKFVKNLNKNKNTITEDIEIDNLQDENDDDDDDDDSNIGSDNSHNTLDELQIAIDNLINW